MDSRFKVKQITKLYESCERCGLPVINCICSIVKKINTKAKIWILSTEREFRRPSNTARLLKLADPDSTELFLWERTNHPKNLFNILTAVLLMYIYSSLLKIPCQKRIFATEILIKI